MKRWTKILLALVGLVVLGVVSIPFFVNANTFRPTIETQLTTTLGRSVKLGDLSLSLFSASLVAKDRAAWFKRCSGIGAREHHVSSKRTSGLE